MQPLCPHAGSTQLLRVRMQLGFQAMHPSRLLTHPPKHQTLTGFLFLPSPPPRTNPSVVTKVSPEELYIVVNAGCREKDLAHLGKHLDAFKVCCAASGAHC